MLRRRSFTGHDERESSISRPQLCVLFFFLSEDRERARRTFTYARRRRSTARPRASHLSSSPLIGLARASPVYPLDPLLGSSFAPRVDVDVDVVVVIPRVETIRRGTEISCRISREERERRSRFRFYRKVGGSDSLFASSGAYEPHVTSSFLTRRASN